MYRILVMAPSVVGVMKIGNSVSRVGLEPPTLAFQASVLPLHHYYTHAHLSMQLLASGVSACY